MENTKPVVTKNTWPPMREVVITLVLQLIIISNVAFLGYTYGLNKRYLFPAPTALPVELRPTPFASSMPGACTMDAKQCPDGSYVGRSGPQCEFAPCPIGTP